MRQIKEKSLEDAGPPSEELRDPNEKHEENSIRIRSGVIECCKSNSARNTNITKKDFLTPKVHLVAYVELIEQTCF